MKKQILVEKSVAVSELSHWSLFFILFIGLIILPFVSDGQNIGLTSTNQNNNMSISLDAVLYLC